jgi:hypothetical protein
MNSAAVLLLGSRCPSSPCRDLLPVKDGEKEAGRNVDAPLSPFFTGRG